MKNYIFMFKLFIRIFWCDLLIIFDRIVIDLRIVIDHAFLCLILLLRRCRLIIESIEGWEFVVFIFWTLFLMCYLLFCSSHGAACFSSALHMQLPVSALLFMCSCLFRLCSSHAAACFGSALHMLLPVSALHNQCY